MEILIAICGIALGLIIGFLLGRSSGKKVGISEDEMNKIIQEKENSFAMLANQKEESYSHLILEKEKAHQQELKLQGENFSQRIEEQQRTFNEMRQSQEKVFNDNLLSQKQTYEKELDTITQHNKAIITELERRHQEAMKALREQFNETTGKMSEQLKNTTEEMLRQRQQEFADSSGERIGKLLEPLQNSLQAMQEKVTENTTQHTALGGKLSESIKNLLEHTESAQASADKLANMLRGNNRYQGTWGERILQEILESLNFKEGIHFDTQVVLKDENGNELKNDEGNKMKPDVILHLDQNKDVIIDSKVSLTHYMKYQESDSDSERDEAIRNHVASIEKHVKELARKDYSSYVAKSKVRMGYVIMFVPNTSALLLATAAKPTLWREAMEQNVYIADEQTLYAALKIVSLTWQQIAQTENHKKVFELAEEMLDRVASFMDYFTRIGKNLESATKSYNDGLKKLEAGGQSIPKTCSKLISLGAKAPKLQKGVDKDLLGLTEE